MPGNDVMEVTVLSDGSLKIETDAVSAANHTSAEAFLREVTRMMGAPATRTHKRVGAAHIHAHGHEEHSH